MQRVAAALAVAAALLACAAPQSRSRAARAVGQRIDLVAPLVGGGDVDVGADRGRVRIVDFWATWCEPCKDELPSLDALTRDLGARGLSVYAVSFDEDAAQIPPFLREVPVSFPVLWDKGGERWSSRYDIERLPTTLLVDRAGVIRFVHEGFDEAATAQTRRQVEQLLAEPAP